jgi:hypothetical protein
MSGQSISLAVLDTDPGMPKWQTRRRKKKFYVSESWMFILEGLRHVLELKTLHAGGRDVIFKKLSQIFPICENGSRSVTYGTQLKIRIANA